MLVAAWKDFQRAAIYSPDAHEIRLIPTLAVRIDPHAMTVGSDNSQDMPDVRHESALRTKPDVRRSR